jgi:hypothetical protein
MDHRRYAKFLLAGLLFALGALAVVYGLFALMYGGDGSGRTYVTLSGHRLDAGFTGAMSAVLGVTLTLCGRVISRRRRVELRSRQ